MSDVEAIITPKKLKTTSSSNDLSADAEEVNLIGVVQQTDINGNIEPDKITATVSTGMIYNILWGQIYGDLENQTDLIDYLNLKFVPYVNALYDIDLNTKNLTTKGTITADEFIASVGITLGGVRKTAWDEIILSWGNIIGDINNQTDLIEKLSEKQDKLDYIPENVENKSANVDLGDSDILYPTQKAVKTYVDTVIDGINYNQVEVFTITEEILNQKYVILTKEITDINSIRVFVDDVGIRAQPGVDYSVSDQYIYWNGYDLNTKLEIGEKLYIYYY